ncbi:MAG: VOC family protein [Phycisphaerales bacterium]|nr:VOC family protein [Planctomycetota bacterium]
MPRLHHLAIICSDYPRSKRFYVDILGLPILAETFRPDRNSYKLDLLLATHADALDPHLRATLPRLELFSFPDPPPRVTNPEARGLRHLALRVSNLDAELSRLSLLGIPAEPIRTDEFAGRRFTFVKDPDDLPIELYEA